jgi:hypothetical protein
MTNTVSRSRVLPRFIAATLLVWGCVHTGAVANAWGHRQIPPGPGWNSEHDFGHGWGFDSTYGWYAGPFFPRNGKGYFRCFDPGYGWHRCPHYGVPEPHRGWGGLWHRW